ncbi:glycosyltransferase family 4 protein [Planotetraspora mira]|uniref:Glycosyl transferase n=1 Tax=Planotetraspora mira TaxID=58121 RepID=A0A8J3X7I0_9ACTN|nr:glycosyltransferase family 4 protein [Planotetraspora mira]GII30336.1 glycosyl transferase [Planotetraspora mira]
MPERVRRWLLGSGAHWLRWAALRLLGLANVWRARRTPAASADVVRILLFHAFGMGGTIRTVLNLSGHLAQGRHVEIISVVRTRDRPFFDVPPGVEVSTLDDRTREKTGVAGLLARLPSVLVPTTEPVYRSCSLWTDVLLVRCLRGLRGGTLITTRPALNLFAAAFAPPEVITIGQEHRHLAAHKLALRKVITRRYGRLDALVTLTEPDRDRYAALLPHLPLACIPNALPALGGGRASLEGRSAVAIGRLDRVKGFDLLIAAWRMVADRHPEWNLRIFGSGPWLGGLAAQIEEAGLEDKVFLMGRTDRVGEELCRAGMFVLSSRSEGRPMVLLEAMSKGLPVVAFDCPTGPAEMIDDRVDGRLVPAEDVEGLARTICDLIEDDQARRELGAAAIRTAAAYDLSVIGREWDHLLDGLVEVRNRRARQTVAEPASISEAPRASALRSEMPAESRPR